MDCDDDGEGYLAKGLNLTKTNYDYATFLPSISSVYSKFCSGYYKITPEGPRNGKQPAGLPDGFKSLDFLDEDKGLFYYKDGLYSAGHAFLKREKSWIDESMVQQRDRSKTWIVGDSGGYQIARGILKFDWKDRWMRNSIPVERVFGRPQLVDLVRSLRQ